MPFCVRGCKDDEAVCAYVLLSIGLFEIEAGREVYRGQQTNLPYLSMHTFCIEVIYNSNCDTASDIGLCEIIF